MNKASSRQGKRANGEGSICRRSNGRGWVGSLTLGHDESGKQIRKFVSGDTQAEVREKLDSLKRDRDRGQMPLNGKLTVGELMERWLAFKARDVRRTTYADYQTHVDKFLKPRLGHLKLDKLSPLHVEDMIVSVLDAGQSPARAVRCLKVLKMSLSQGVDWGLTSRNAAERVKAPKVVRQEMKVWTPEQAQRFLKAAEGHRYYALFYTAIATGMRRGELMGLRWGDVDFSQQQLTVARSVVYLQGKLHLSEPKTAAGKRTVTISPDVLEVLKEHRTSYGHGDTVFCSGSGAWLTPTNVTRKMVALCEHAGVPRIRFHDLRHTSASLLIRSNVPVKVVSDRLGHADSSFTLRTYVHVFDDQRRAAALSLADMLEEARD